VLHQLTIPKTGNGGRPRPGFAIGEHNLRC
jgi:hypothetical protein